MVICFVWIEVIDFDLGIMSNGGLVPSERSARLSNEQRFFILASCQRCGSTIDSLECCYGVCFLLTGGGWAAVDP
jgi:hypothetical protein